LKRPSEHKRNNIELEDERGQKIMTQSVLEKVGVEIDEAACKASRAATAVADALEDGGGAVRRVTKQGSNAAEELLHDTRKRVQQHPLKTVAATLAAGIGAGAAISWMMRRKPCCNSADAQEKTQ
jgi:ElaB/YqjD/DUF883 family membrane-anchored ribosome-binding protein